MHEPPELEPTHAPLVELQSSAPRDLSAIARALTPQDGGDDLIRRLRGALERKG